MAGGFFDGVFDMRHEVGDDGQIGIPALQIQGQVAQTQDAVIERESSEVVADAPGLVEPFLCDRVFQLLQGLQSVAGHRHHQLQERFVADQTTQLRQAGLVEYGAFFAVGARGWLGCQFGDGRQKLGRVEWLAQHLVHAAGEAGHAVLTQHIGRDGDNRHVATRTREVANLGRGRRSVHDGHLHVHQDDVVMTTLHGLDGLAAVADFVDEVAGALEDHRNKHQVDGIILGDEHAQPPRGH